MKMEDIEPVAVAYNYDGYGYQYVDSGSGSDWLKVGKSKRDAVVLVDLEDVKALVSGMSMEYITLFGELQDALEELKGLKDE
jgi:hypothetical protein